MCHPCVPLFLADGKSHVAQAKPRVAPLQRISVWPSPVLCQESGQVGFAWLQVFGIEGSYQGVTGYKLVESLNKFYKELLPTHSFVYGGTFVSGA